MIVTMPSRSRTREHHQKPDKQKIDLAISAYYYSLTDEERAEERLWAEFAETQFPLDSDCDLPHDLSSPTDRL
jgi:hypothetical protein